MPSFSYANPGAFQYHSIDPSVFKFSKSPAFGRPPTPPVFKPPTNPFGEPKPEKKEEKKEEKKDAEPEKPKDAAPKESRRCYINLDGYSHY